jgi:hypothetical protein
VRLGRVAGGRPHHLGLALERGREPRKVAGYGVPKVVPGDGLFLDDIEWTPSGIEFAREYCDLSPAVARGKDGVVCFLHSVALCRQGAVPDLSFYSVTLNTKQGDAAMDRSAWLKILNRPEETTDAELAEAIQAHLTTLSAAPAAMGAHVEAFRAEITTLTAALAEANKKIEAFGAIDARLGEIEAGISRRDRAEICAQAAREGKVLPLSAEQVAATALDTLRDMVARLPVTVPLEKRTADAIVTHGVNAGDTAIDVVAARCGVDPKKVREQSRT